MKPKSNVVKKKFGDELVLLNTENGDYFSLNESGTIIWNLLEEVSSVEKLVEKISERFDLSTDSAQRDAKEFLDHLSKYNLLN